MSEELSPKQIAEQLRKNPPSQPTGPMRPEDIMKIASALIGSGNIVEDVKAADAWNKNALKTVAQHIVAIEFKVDMLLAHFKIDIPKAK